MGASRFRYALEPIALQRRWTFDELQRQLGERNAELARECAARDAVLAQVAGAGEEWKALGAGGQVVTAERFALIARYLAERRAQAEQMALAIATLQEALDALVGRMVAARRALDAVEEHREQMREEFIKARLSGEFKVADDQWNVLRAREQGHGN
jgi:hypothetical protein